MAGHFSGLTDRMGRLELHLHNIDQNQQTLRQEMMQVQQSYTDVRVEQSRARASYDEYYGYVQDQWGQYWSLNPPPPPPPPDQF